MQTHIKTILVFCAIPMIACHADIESVFFVTDSGVTDSGVTDSGVTDSGVTDSGVTDSGMDATTYFPDTGTSQPDACANVDITAESQTTIVFIIDQSTSMDNPFGSGSRWSVLKNIILSDSGIIASYQNIVRFGVALYSSRNGFSGGSCPLVTEVDPSLSNLTTIRSVYGPATTIGDTPTGESINHVVAGLPNTENTVFILATDGEPDTCDVPNPQTGQLSSVSAVANAFNVGIKTYIIAVANENELSQNHINELANAGIGQSNAASYRVNNDQALRNVLESIVYDGISCDLVLRGQTDSLTCEGVVTLSGVSIQCSQTNGWYLLNRKTIRLSGEACDEFKRGASLRASFPCGSVI